jgi:fructoselysine-6-P-deglycase FrlB-like protein
MEAHAFLADLEAKPATMRALAERLETEDPWARVLPERPDRVVLVGMGSSRFAAGVVARRLRGHGVDAWAELASVERQHPGGPGTLAVVVTASGGTAETVAAAGGFAPGTTVVAMTNVVDSAVSRVAEGATLDMEAGVEAGGVACRTFQHTLALLLALEARLSGGTARSVAEAVRRSAEATEDLLERRDAWLPRVADLLGAAPASFVLAPAERISSAQQSALMFREGPRRPSDACESGDWLHVDVYLTKPLDYRALSFVGSRFDAEVMGWVRDRGSTVVAVGGDLPGAADVVTYRHQDDREVALLTETLVGELIAATWWLDRMETEGG